MDNELRNQLEAINKRLDNLSQTDKEKPKTSAWKRITIAVPVAVAMLGLLGTGYELGLRFIENQSNRKIIEFYTVLARSLVENGQYNAAKVYLVEAEDIDANNSDVVSTKAFIDMMELVRDNVKSNPETLRDAVYNLAKLNLRDEEMFYHIGTVASQEGMMEISEENFRKIPPTTNRFSLRARSRLLDVYIRTLEGRVEMDWDDEELIGFIMELMPRYINDVLLYSQDPELKTTLIDDIHAQAFSLTFLLPLDDLLNLNDLLVRINPRNEELMVLLNSEIQTLQAGESPDTEARLSKIMAVQEKSSKSSPLSRETQAAITQYSAYVENEKGAVVVTRNDYEQKRLDGMALSRKKNQHQQAEKVFMEIIADYKQNGYPADETLYKTYFDLGLLYEYQLRDPHAAIPYYQRAEDLAAEIDIKDPSIHNTFGFLYYKLGRDATDTEDKIRFLELAEEKLQTALAMRPGYDKSERNLAAVETEFKKIEQAASYQQQAQQIPQMKLSTMKR